MTFKKIAETQDGELVVRESPFGEWGMMVAKDKKLVNAIWFDSKDDMRDALNKILEVVE